ncbi:UDP-2,3-diacylglucosamine hydrolase [Maioricimonas rarisocia]|uniref:UDP-2,3-diacylglucosamine hydrolase n=1 Tax=Maioricimonas rarisocia TaxID=2528026 RepID=A0A517ZDW0_9PLAN|nr:UDP-2,3-diacylglucosamine diphosphatase [Maioricimonas rarisocia]QDU40663.1 UDP-2,3-diacylglucosamine hydrolase [Maioricimonas rarisocia]
MAAPPLKAQRQVGRTSPHSLETEQSVRTLFVSDLHLGCRHAQAGAFLEYISRHLPRELYLVGDVIDGWKLGARWRWTAEYSSILERLNYLVKHGTRIYYTPGNHDAFLRDELFSSVLRGKLGSIEIADEFVFSSVSGRRLLVIHGDQFDNVEEKAQWVSRLGARAHDYLLSMNRLVSRMRRVEDRSPYAYCGRIKRRVKQKVCESSRFRERLLEHAHSRGCDGVVCGHLHSPLVADIDGMLYANVGDWVEHCTAMIEYEDGSLVLDHYYAGDREHVSVEVDSQPLLSKQEVAATASAGCAPVSGCRSEA